MLSLEDVRNVSFRRAKFGGYRPEDVDAFVDDLQVSYEEILRERDEMIAKIKKMKSFVDKFQAEDVSIKDVILNAKTIAEKSLSDAKAETQNMITEAEESSKKMIEEAKKEVSVQSEIAERIKAESSKIKAKLADIYKSHMELINNIPGEVEQAFSEKETDSAPKEEEKPRLTPEEKVNKIINAASVDIFSEPNVEDVSGGVSDDRFKDLKFGSNYKPEDEQEKNKGLYNGIFEN